MKYVVEHFELTRQELSKLIEALGLSANVIRTEGYKGQDFEMQLAERCETLGGCYEAILWYAEHISGVLGYNSQK